jgi:hypothetical protein
MIRWLHNRSFFFSNIQCIGLSNDDLRILLNFQSNLQRIIIKGPQRLIDNMGFNDSKEDGTTRLGFDMVITKRNVEEVERTLRYCRDNNLWVVFSTYPPTNVTPTTTRPTSAEKHNTSPANHPKYPPSKSGSKKTPQKAPTRFACAPNR